MGMSIDKAIEILYERDKCMEYVTDNDGEAFELAIATMRKYQQIEEIVNAWRHDITAGDYHCMAEVAEVVENGNDD